MVQSDGTKHMLINYTDMLRNYSYRCARMAKGKRSKLKALFNQLAWVRNDAVAYCRKRYAEDGSTPSVFDLKKRLTDMRKEDAHTAPKPVAAQRSMLRRVRGGYDRLFKHGAGRPRFGPDVNSFELHASKPRRAGKGWTATLCFPPVPRDVLHGMNRTQIVRAWHQRCRYPF